MAIFRRFRVQQKYVNGQPTEEYRLGVEVDGTNYHSLEACERGSECTELEYRWVDMESADDYICDGTNKYKKQKKQQKCVNEETWTDVYPYEYQKGELIEHDSVDCGYVSGEYHIYGATDGHGSINISPSKEYYSSTDIVTITALPSTDYMFSCYNYGSTSEYGQISTNSTLMLTMTHDWYVSAVFSYSLSLYYLYTLINGEGSIMVTPSKHEYSRQENVNILAFPSANYMFEYYEYGSTPAYGSTRLRADLDLTMSNNWYVKANFIYGTASSGSLYYCYSTGSESWYDWSKSTLSKNDNIGWKASVIIDYGGAVQTIPSSAFYSQSDLTKIVFPNCTYINVSAFEKCRVLSSIVLPNCSYVGYAAFGFCSSLSYINLPNCSYVSDYAFIGCRALLSVNLPNCSYVGSRAFRDCLSLLHIDLPNCSYVGSYAFEYCLSLSYIDLPNCSYIDNQAFKSCYSLSYINLPNCLYISTSAFSQCSKLIYVNLPLCTYVGENAFWDCILLPSIDLPNCSYVGSYAFGFCSVLSSVDLPLCTHVDGYAFEYCLSLSYIDLPNCSYVGNNAFGNCKLLSSIDLPNCSYIGNYGFISCRNLSLVHLPKITYIGSSAFNYTHIETLYMDHITSVPSGNDPYINSSYIKSIFIPCSLLDDFRNHSIWSKYSSYFVCV